MDRYGWLIKSIGIWNRRRYFSDQECSQGTITGLKAVEDKSCLLAQMGWSNYGICGRIKKKPVAKFGSSEKFRCIH